MSSEVQAAKKLVLDYFKEMEQCAPGEAEAVLSKYMAPNCDWEGSYPFMFQNGAANVAKVFWKPLKEALRCMQRRMDVFMGGVAKDGKIWVASMGQFMGLYDKELLNIRITGKMQHLQYFEFNCVEDGRITDSALFVDLLGFMREAGVSPLPFETGHYFVYPGPRDHNGLLFDEQPTEKAAAARQAVDNMIADLDKQSSSGSFDTVPVERMRGYWTDDMIWYGPCGVGASFTIPRYLQQHSGPFRRYLDEKGYANADSCFLKKDAPGFAKRDRILKSEFAEGDFSVLYCNMRLTPLGGWLGLPGGGKNVPLHADLDFYYCKDGKISENWCYFDIPYYMACQGVDIFERTAGIVNPQPIED